MSAGTSFAAQAIGIVSDTASWYEPPHMVWGYGWAGLAMWVLFLALLIAAAVVVWRLVDGGAFPVRGLCRDSALDIARARYARGEIDRAEFEEMRRVLAGEEPMSARGQKSRSQ